MRKSPETADVREGHRTTGAQTTEPGHHNGEFVKDVRVSPIDEGVGVVEEDELSRAARRVRTGASGHAEQHEVGVVTLKTAVTVHHVGARRTSFWEQLGSISCQKKCIKRCHRVSPEENDSACVPKFRVPGDDDLQNPPPPPSHDDTSDEVPKLQQLKIGSVRGLVILGFQNTL